MKTSKDLFLFSLSVVCFLECFCPGCPQGQGDPLLSRKKQKRSRPQTETRAGSHGVQPLMSGTDFATAPRACWRAVNFDYMSAELTPEARTALEEKTRPALKSGSKKRRRDLKCAWEGHCDDRGHAGIQHGLGPASRQSGEGDYYATLGVTKSALDTISFGEERPVCTEASEECWGAKTDGVKPR
jgi:outer membrane protein OmpA-like peptidoglycan-associated protein